MRRIVRDESGQVAIVMFLLMGVPLFIFSMAIAVNFGAVYYQRSQFQGTAELAVEAASGTGTAGTQYAGAGGCGGPAAGGNGVLPAGAAAQPQSAQTCGAFVGDVTLAANLHNDHLAVPPGAAVSYLPAGSLDPCDLSGAPLASASYAVQFRAVTHGLLFSQAAFGLEHVAYPICAVASVRVMGVAG